MQSDAIEVIESPPMQSGPIGRPDAMIENIELFGYTMQCAVPRWGAWLFLKDLDDWWESREEEKTQITSMYLHCTVHFPLGQNFCRGPIQ